MRLRVEGDEQQPTPTLTWLPLNGVLEILGECHIVLELLLGCPREAPPSVTSLKVPHLSGTDISLGSFRAEGEEGTVSVYDEEEQALRRAAPAAPACAKDSAFEHWKDLINAGAAGLAQTKSKTKQGQGSRLVQRTWTNRRSQAPQNLGSNRSVPCVFKPSRGVDIRVYRVMSASRPR